MSWKFNINTEHPLDVYNYIEVKDSHHTFTVYLTKEEDSIGDVTYSNPGELINSSIVFKCFPGGDRDGYIEGKSSSKHGFIPCPHCGLVPPKEFMKFVKNPLLLKMGNKL